MFGLVWFWLIVFFVFKVISCLVWGIEGGGGMWISLRILFVFCVFFLVCFFFEGFKGFRRGLVLLLMFFLLRVERMFWGIIIFLDFFFKVVFCMFDGIVKICLLLFCFFWDWVKKLIFCWVIKIKLCWLVLLFFICVIFNEIIVLVVMGCILGIIEDLFWLIRVLSNFWFFFCWLLLGNFVFLLLWSFRLLLIGLFEFGKLYFFFRLIGLVILFVMFVFDMIKLWVLFIVDWIGIVDLVILLLFELFCEWVFFLFIILLIVCL